MRWKCIRWYRRRPARLGARVALVIVGLLGAGLTCGCRRESPADALRYVPAEATTVLQVDAARLRGTLLDQRLKTLLAHSDFLRWKVEDLAKKTGCDLQRDLESLVVGVAVAPPGGGAQEAAVVAVGRFDRSRVVAWFQDGVRAYGAEPREERHGRYTIYPSRDETWSLAFVGRRTLLLGSKGWIRKMLDLAEGQGRDVRSRAEMSALLARASAPAVARVVVHLAEGERRLLQKRAGASDGAASAIGAVSAIVASLDSTTVLAADVRVDHESADDALRLADRFNGFMKEVRTGRLVSALQGVSGTAEGSTFRARATVTEQQLEDIVGTIEARSAARVAEALQGGLPGGPPRASPNPFGGLLGPAPQVGPATKLPPGGHAQPPARGP